MSLDIATRAVTTRASDFEPDEAVEVELLWIENLVAGLATGVAVVVVSSVAVLMYLA